jgi:hypothetical protein
MNFQLGAQVAVVTFAFLGSKLRCSRLNVAEGNEADRYTTMKYRSTMVIKTRANGDNKLNAGRLTVEGSHFEVKGTILILLKRLM